MTHFEAYLLTRLDSLDGLFIAMTIAATFATIICTVWATVAWEANRSNAFKENKFAKKLMMGAIVSLVIGGSGQIIIPSTKEMAFIYTAPIIVNNQDMQKATKSIPEVTALGLDYIKDLLETKIKEPTK